VVADESEKRAVAGEPRDGQAAPRRPPSRRGFLTGSAAGATAAILSACSGAKPLREKVRGGGTVSRSDIEPLNALLDVEHYAVAAYAAGIPLLHHPHTEAAVQFLAQELAHTVQLSDLIRHVRGEPHRPLAGYNLGDPKRAADVLTLLKRIEQAQLRAYLQTIPRLQGSGSRAVAVSIMANDAQHLAFLRWQSGEPPVPSALVTGT
jgi:hypothetical protein